MSVAKLEILVEELSMEAALRLVVPKIIGDLSFDVYPYQCKEDLLKKLPARLKGYAAWMPKDTGSWSLWTATTMTARM